MSATRSIADLPGPRGLPLLGNAHHLRASRMHLIAEEWARRYGPIVRVKWGPGRTVVYLSDPDEIHRILRERPADFRRWRATEMIAREMAGNGSLPPPGVFLAEGDEWKRQRRLVVSALNANHLRRYFDVVRTSAERLHRRLAGVAGEGRPIEISRELTSYTIDTISALAFGHDLNTLERGEVELQRHIQRILQMTTRRAATPVPYWRWVRLPADRALDSSNAALDAAVKGFIEQARRRMAARPELHEKPENLLEAMLAAQEGDDDEARFTDEEIVANARTIISAGEDTTAHTLSWTVWLLASRPDVQARIAAETDAVLGETHFPVGHETVAGLTYCEAVIREALRLKTPAPLLTLEPLLDTTICDTRIPAGTRLLVLLREANRQREGSPDEFEPQRWLGSESEAAAKSLTFGAGPRFCPGRNLAFLEATSALATIVHNFEIELDRSAPPVREHFGFTMFPEGLSVRLRPRPRVAETVRARV